MLASLTPALLLLDENLVGPIFPTALAHELLRNGPTQLLDQKSS